MEQNTTFPSVRSLFDSTSRSAELTRSAARTEVVDEFTLRNRSNYTRIECNGTWGWVADLRVGGLRIMVPAHMRNAYANVITRDIYTDKLCECLHTADEMRKMAYTLLAAANAIDGCDSRVNQVARRPVGTRTVTI